MPEDKDIIDFDYMKLEFSDDLVKAFSKMQKIYVMDNESLMTIDDAKDVVKKLLEMFRNL